MQIPWMVSRLINTPQKCYTYAQRTSRFFFAINSAGNKGVYLQKFWQRFKRFSREVWNLRLWLGEVFRGPNGNSRVVRHFPLPLRFGTRSLFTLRHGLGSVLIPSRSTFFRPMAGLESFEAVEAKQVPYGQFEKSHKVVLARPKKNLSKLNGYFYANRPGLRPFLCKFHRIRQTIFVGFPEQLLEFRRPRLSLF